jgi:hypothetical protein
LKRSKGIADFIAHRRTRGVPIKKCTPLSGGPVWQYNTLTKKKYCLSFHSLLLARFVFAEEKGNKIFFILLFI